MVKIEQKNIVSNLNKIAGKENVLSRPEEIIAYTTDTITRNLPQKEYYAVVFPQTTQEIQEIVKFANKTGVAIIPRGAGTNLCGACTPLENSILMCFSRMSNIIEINRENMYVIAQPGVVIADLQKELDNFGLFFPPDPSNLAVSTLGGAAALSSGGPKTFKYGTMKDYVIDLKVVLSSGEVINTSSKTAKNVTGYNLTQLMVGSEGTLGIISELTLKIIPKPKSQKIMLAYFDSVEKAASAVNTIILNNIVPSVMDLMDFNTINSIEDFYPTGLDRSAKAAILIEADGEEYDVNNQLKVICSIFKDFGVSSFAVANTAEEEQKLWIARRSAYGACIKIAPDILTEDIVVPRAKISDMVNFITAIGKKYNLIINIMGHIGDGNIHPHFCLDRRIEKDYNNFLKAKKELFEEAIELGGTLSGEHGIGCEKSDFIPKAVDKISINLMHQIKNIFDPKNILNPGKIIF